MINSQPNISNQSHHHPNLISILKKSSLEPNEITDSVNISPSITSKNHHRHSHHQSNIHISKLHPLTDQILILKNNQPKIIEKHSYQYNSSDPPKESNPNPFQIISSHLNNIAIERDNSVTCEEAEEPTKNLRQIIDRFLSIGNRALYLELFLSIITALSFIFYFVCTYIPHLFFYLNYIDIGLCIIYFLDYLLRVILSHHILIYLISIESIINLLTMIPPMLFFLTDDYMHNFIYIFINFTRVFRVLRIFRIFSRFKNEENNVYRQITMILITLLQVILISGGIIQLVEFAEVEDKIKVTREPFALANLHMRTKLHHYLYFIVVTISTVGFGDIYPLTTLGKGIFMVIVLIIIVLIPYQTNDLIQLIGAQSDYARNSYKASREIPHILLTGDISLDSLRSFCQELFHCDHGSQFRHAVIISNEIPSREMEIFLNEKPYESLIFYLQGNPLNEKDLIRADAHKAKACIIFNNKNSKDPHTGDHQSLFLGIFIKKFVYNYRIDQANNKTDLSEYLIAVNPQFRLCMQLNKPESSCHYYNTLQQLYKKRMKPDQLIVIESIKMNLLSKSCLTPGIMALITNLVMSSGEFNDNNEAEWMKEYSEGRGHEIYRIQLSNYYKGKNYNEIVANVYKHEQAIAFALEIEVGGTSIVKLNPISTAKISELIQKAKESCDKIKENPNDNHSNTKRDNSINPLPLAGEDNSSREKLNQNNNIDNSRIKVFAYIICSDKSVADKIANREKDSDSIEEGGPCINQSIMIPMTTTQVCKFNNNANILPMIPSGGYYSDSDSDEGDESDNDDIVQFSSSDLDFNRNDFYFNHNNEHYQNNIEIMHHSIKDSDDITNHIIICGLHPSLVHFILPLRAKYLQEEALKWIVILAPSLPQHLFESFTKFPRIIFIQGSPLLPENLFRANIVNADKAVILSSGESKVIRTIATKENPKDKKQPAVETEEQMLDAETIFIYKAIKKCNKTIQIMTELICTNNIEYLLNTSNLEKLFFKQNSSSTQYEFTPIYASGEVFTPSIIDLITCQSYYNPHIVTIIDLFLGGEHLPNKRTKKLEEATKLGGSNLYLVKIPEAYINESFEDFFFFLIKHHHSIGIALYRRNIIENFYYVYTNPKKTTLLRDCDFVFVLSNTNSILDLIDERPIGNEGIHENHKSGSQTDEEESIMEEVDQMVDVKNINAAISLLQNTSNGLLVQSRKRGAVVGQTIITPLKERKSIKIATKRNSITQMYPIEQKRKVETKHNEIDVLQERLKRINRDLKELANDFNSLPTFIENTIEKEFNSELKVYLTQN